MDKLLVRNYPVAKLTNRNNPSFIFNPIKLKISAIIFLLLLILNPAVYSQVDSSNHIPFYTQTFEDGKALATQPLRWKTKDWLTLGGVAAGTYLAYSFTDEEVHQYFSDRPELKEKTIFKISKMYGEPLISGVIAGGLSLYAYTQKDEEAAQIAFEIVESVVYSLSLNVAIKTFVGRSRPFREEGNHKFKLINLDYETTAFPSGHSTVAFSLSSVLAAHTENYFYKTLLFAPAFLTATQRLVQDQHWSSDVIAGSAIGFFIGNYLVSRHRDRDYFPFFLASDGESLNLIISYEF